MRSHACYELDHGRCSWANCSCACHRAVATKIRPGPRVMRWVCAFIGHDRSPSAGWCVRCGNGGPT